MDVVNGEQARELARPSTPTTRLLLLPDLLAAPSP
jgi:hypothetical protein